MRETDEVRNCSQNFTISNLDPHAFLSLCRFQQTPRYPQSDNFYRIADTKVLKWDRPPDRHKFLPGFRLQLMQPLFRLLGLDQLLFAF